VAQALVVDDSATDRVLAGRLLEQGGDIEVAFAGNGREALEAVRQRMPDVIVCDLQMPEMNGLELVEAIKREYPAVPVVLMTARGSEAIAAEALRKGAASYVPKMILADHLRETVNRILGAANADRRHSRLMHALEECRCRFRLRNDPGLIEPLTAHVQEMLRSLPLGDEAERLRVGQAVKHALWVAHRHGNLEIPLDTSLSDSELQRLVGQRSDQAPYASRSMVVEVHVSGAEVVITVSHEGPGIDVAALPDDLEAAAVDKSWLAAFVIVPSIMDDVRYDDGGRTIGLLKKAVLDGAAEFEIADEECDEAG
jgi:CheY-like chemotaxis protein